MTKTRSIYAMAAAAGVVLALAAGSAQARDVNWSIGVGVPGVAMGYGAPAPVYMAPPPVYVAPPRPVYYAPPVVYAPPPVYYRGPGHRHWRGHDRRGPRHWR